MMEAALSLDLTLMTTAQFPFLRNAAQSLSQGNIGDAVRWCRVAQVAAPHISETYQLFSGIADMIGQPEAALAQIDRAMGLAVGNPLYPWQKGNLLYRQGRRQEAVA